MGVETKQLYKKLLVRMRVSEIDASNEERMFTLIGEMAYLSPLSKARLLLSERIFGRRWIREDKK